MYTQCMYMYGSVTVMWCISKQVLDEIVLRFVFLISDVLVSIIIFILPGRFRLLIP
jgi:hypothetical protein